MKKILIIDDDNELNHLTKIVLVNAGYEVETSCDAESGINYVKQYNPDLILMDIRLPGINGADAVKQIKANGGSNETKVVFLTATVSPHIKNCEEGLNVDGRHYPALGKPYEIERLVQVVGKVLYEGII